jgi:hypothetical protein
MKYRVNINSRQQNKFIQMPDFFLDKEQSLLLCRKLLARSVSLLKFRSNLYKIAYFLLYFLLIFIRSFSVLVLGFPDYITSEFLGILNFLSTFDCFCTVKLFLVIRDSGFIYYFYLN